MNIKPPFAVAVVQVKGALPCAQAHVGTSSACMAAVAIQPFRMEGWRGSMGYPVQSRDQRLTAYLSIYLFLTVKHGPLKAKCINELDPMRICMPPYLRKQPTSWWDPAHAQGCRNAGTTSVLECLLAWYPLFKLVWHGFAGIASQRILNKWHGIHMKFILWIRCCPTCSAKACVGASISKIASFHHLVSGIASSLLNFLAVCNCPGLDR